VLHAMQRLVVSTASAATMDELSRALLAELPRLFGAGCVGLFFVEGGAFTARGWSRPAPAPSSSAAVELELQRTSGEPRRTSIDGRLSTLVRLRAGADTVGGLVLFGDGHAPPWPVDAALVDSVSVLLVQALQRLTGRGPSATQDATSKEGIEDRLSATEGDLQQALRLRDEFMSIASHELATPLTVLRLQVDALHRKVSRAEGQHLEPGALLGSLDTVTKQVDRLSRLVADLLDLSRIRSRRFHLDLEALELSQIVADVVSRLQPLAAARGCQLEVTERSEATGYWDRLRIEQVLANLISNATKYGAGKPIEVSVRATDELAILSVKDLGIGIAPEDAARIFARFERATSVGKAESLGLGLFITHEIVKAHGGSIIVDSAPGRGATFRVELPRHAQRASKDEGP
jgi:signal transduction histidine kinase